MTESRIAFVTCPTDDASRIAGALVGARLVACVNVVPLVRSVYEWQGEIRHDDESLLVLKSVSDRLLAIERLLSDVHPYDVFELVALDIVDGSAPYLRWITEIATGQPAER